MLNRNILWLKNEFHSLWREDNEMFLASCIRLWCWHSCLQPLIFHYTFHNIFCSKYLESVESLSMKFAGISGYFWWKLNLLMTRLPKAADSWPYDASSDREFRWYLDTCSENKDQDPNVIKNVPYFSYNRREKVCARCYLNAHQGPML